MSGLGPLILFGGREEDFCAGSRLPEITGERIELMAAVQFYPRGHKKEWDASRP